MAGAKPDDGKLTTHVLDTMSGRPGAGLLIELFRLDGGGRVLVASARTNDDGRCDAPLLAGGDFKPGEYELLFHVSDYFAAAGANLTDPPFLTAVPVRFGVSAAGQHYHVPLLISPYGYSTYRGS